MGGGGPSGSDFQAVAVGAVGVFGGARGSACGGACGCSPGGRSGCGACGARGRGGTTRGGGWGACARGRGGTTRGGGWGLGPRLQAPSWAGAGRGASSWLHVQPPGAQAPAQAPGGTLGGGCILGTGATACGGGASGGGVRGHLFCGGVNGARRRRVWVCGARGCFPMWPRGREWTLTDELEPKRLYGRGPPGNLTVLWDSRRRKGTSWGRLGPGWGHLEASEASNAAGPRGHETCWNV